MDIFPKFKTSDLNNSYKRNGYVVVPFLSLSECDELIEIYNQYAENKELEFNTTMNAQDVAKKAFINRTLCNKVEAHLPKLIDGFHPLFANFIVKKSKSSYKVGIHQDWTYVDESKFRSFNVWVALCDTNKANGGLSVLPKSHLLPLPIRFTPFQNNLHPFEKLIRLRSKSITIKKGFAVIYDSALIHFSNANKTNQTRYAFGGVCIPHQAIPKHFYIKNKMLYEYDVNESFYNNFKPGEKPNGRLVKEFPLEKKSNVKLFFHFMTL